MTVEQEVKYTQHKKVETDPENVVIITIDHKADAFFQWPFQQTLVGKEGTGFCF